MQLSNIITMSDSQIAIKSTKGKIKAPNQITILIEDIINTPNVARNILFFYCIRTVQAGK